MNTQDAINTLQGIRKRFLTHSGFIERKRSLRPSEKAMALASYAREIEAIDTAIKQLEKEDGQHSHD